MCDHVMDSSSEYSSLLVLSAGFANTSSSPSKSHFLLRVLKTKGRMSLQQRTRVTDGRRSNCWIEKCSPECGYSVVVIFMFYTPHLPDS